MPAHRPPPRPTPPPPQYYSDATEIQSYFDALEFVTLPSSVQAQINSIEATWRTNHRLVFNDYIVLRSEAQRHQASLKASRARSKRRRP